MPAPVMSFALSFATCDGYGAPEAKRDGLGVPLRQPGPAASVTPEMTVEACNQALQSPVLVPQYWARKLSLLESLALAHLALGQVELATKDLRSARDVAAPRMGDRFFLYTGEVGLKLIESELLLTKGQTAQAQQLWGSISAARPYDIRLQEMLAQRLAATNATADTLEPVITRLAKLGPKAAYDATTLLLDKNKITCSRAIGLHVDPATFVTQVPLDYMSPSFPQELVFRIELAVEELRLAYACSAPDSGNDAQAFIAIDSISKNIETHFPKKGGYVDFTTQNGLNKGRVLQMIAGLTGQYQKLVNARANISQTRPEAAGPLIEASQTFPNEAAPLLQDLLKNADTSTPQGKANVETIRARLTEINAGRTAWRARTLLPGTVYALIPHTSYSEIASRYVNSGTGLFARGDGFKIEQDTNDTFIASYTSYNENAAEATDLVLLGAAHAALERHQRQIELLDLAQVATRNRLTQSFMNSETRLRIAFSSEAANNPLKIDAQMMVGFLDPIYAASVLKP